MGGWGAWSGLREGLDGGMQVVNPIYFLPHRGNGFHCNYQFSTEYKPVRMELVLCSPSGAKAAQDETTFAVKNELPVQSQMQRSKVNFDINTLR